MDDAPDLSAVDRFFDALAANDMVALSESVTDDFVLWHGFDGIAYDRNGAIDALGQFAAAFPTRFIADEHRQSTASGCVQQHLMVVETGDGQRRAWPVCVVIRMSGDRIARLDEYIDRSGSFDPGGGVPRTPGL